MGDAAARLRSSIAGAYPGRLLSAGCQIAEHVQVPRYAIGGGKIPRLLCRTKWAYQVQA